MAAKPSCTLGDLAGMYAVLFRVRDTLEAADRDEQLQEFLERAEGCRSREELIHLATDYVELA